MGYRDLLPWFLPGMAVSAAVGLVVARPLARLTGVRPWVAWVLVVGLGVIVAATLTPLHGSLNLGAVAETCDTSRVGLAPLRELVSVDDTSLNILLFIPFAAGLGIVVESRPRAVLVAFAIVLPFAIETTQLLVPSLERGCQTADIVDNLTGLAVGFAIGTGYRRISDALTHNR